MLCPVNILCTKEWPWVMQLYFGLTIREDKTLRTDEAVLLHINWLLYKKGYKHNHNTYRQITFMHNFFAKKEIPACIFYKTQDSSSYMDGGKLFIKIILQKSDLASNSNIKMLVSLEFLCFNYANNQLFVLHIHKQYSSKCDQMACSQRWWRQRWLQFMHSE